MVCFGDLGLLLLIAVLGFGFLGLECAPSSRMGYVDAYLAQSVLEVNCKDVHKKLGASYACTASR